jgi:hypothetical protein
MNLQLELRVEYFFSGKWFRFKCNAIRHREIHFEEKRFDCSICHMKFRHSSSLKRHMLSHQGKAEYVCEQCGRSFKMKQTQCRKLPIQLCSSVLFHCVYCVYYKYAFSHIAQIWISYCINCREILFRWYEILDEREQCGRSFKMKQTLIQHHRIHVIQPFLKCEYCPREFRTYKGKKYHILKDHAEKAGDFSRNVTDFASVPIWSNIVAFFVRFQLGCCFPSASTDQTDVGSIFVMIFFCVLRTQTAAQLKAHKKSHNVTPYRYRCKVCNIPFQKLRKYGCTWRKRVISKRVSRWD